MSDLIDKRYLYNGKELNKDFGLNWYDYGVRWYDARVGRFPCIDPLAEKYYSWSGYNYVMDSPVRLVDPDGRVVVIPTTTKGSHRRKIMRNLRRLTDDKLTYNKITGKVEIKKTRSRNKPQGTTLIRNLIADTHITTISVGVKGSGNSANAVNWTDAQNGTGSDATVSFDLTSNPSILSENSKTGKVSRKKRPKQIGLGHELIHADHINNGDVDLTPTIYTYKDETGTLVTQMVRSEELRTVGLKGVKAGDVTENDLRKEQRRTRKKKRVAY